jgi:hypothetical protein
MVCGILSFKGFKRPDNHMGVQDEAFSKSWEAVSLLAGEIVLYTE